ncbi:MAG: hypothetical protein QOH87_2749, partial [Trebonia sp.]|nr:hypothetical protein [Trebonia sp.]
MSALGAVTGALIAAGLVLGGGQALAATPAIPAAPLTGSASATLTQVNAAEWTTTIYLDTAALCAGSNSAGDEFSLVTSKPNSVTSAAAPAYPNGPLACVAAAASPVTEVTLTFTPSLSAVPLTAALTVTPPQALLLAGDPPLQVPLTVRRTVSPWQLVGIPAICGGALAVLLVLALVAMGMPGKGASQPAAPAKHEPVAPGQPVPPRQSGQAPQRGRVDYGVLLHLFLMTKRRELLVTEMPVTGGKGEEVAKREAVAERAADEAPPRAGAGVRAKRVRWGLEFWRTPLFAAAA